jgi:4'-phosphopantetheinyl transferase
MHLPPSDEVHIRALDLTNSRAATALTSAELRRAERQGPRWASARAGVRTTLAAYLGSDPAGLRLDETAKPRLEPRSPLRFNLSHAGDVALIAVATEREVGIDVEAIDRSRDVGRLARRMFTSAEQAAVAEAADPQLAYHRHWVAKEAFSKATGRGLASMRSFEVSLDGPEGARLVHVGNDQGEARRWSLRLLGVTEPYVAAVVFEGDAKVVFTP